MDSEFLKQVESLNEEYCSIRINGELESLAIPFWSYEEIEIGLALREEWEVPLNLNRLAIARDLCQTLAGKLFNSVLF